MSLWEQNESPMNNKDKLQMIITRIYNAEISKKHKIFGNIFFNFVKKLLFNLFFEDTYSKFINKWKIRH